MMDKAVDHGCGHLVIRKDTAPFRELQVSRLAYLHGKHHLHTVCANRPQIFLRFLKSTALPDRAAALFPLRHSL